MSFFRDKMDSVLCKACFKTLSKCIVIACIVRIECNQLRTESVLLILTNMKAIDVPSSQDRIPPMFPKQHGPYFLLYAALLARESQVESPLLGQVSLTITGIKVDPYHAASRWLYNAQQ